MGGGVTRGSRDQWARRSAAAQLRTRSISGRLMCSGRSRHRIRWRVAVRGRASGIAGRSFAHVGRLFLAQASPGADDCNVHACGAGGDLWQGGGGGTRASAAHHTHPAFFSPVASRMPARFGFSGSREGAKCGPGSTWSLRRMNPHVTEVAPRKSRSPSSRRKTAGASGVVSNST